MKVYINQEEYVFDNQLTINELIDAVKIDPQGMAIAINNKVIPKSEWGIKRIEEQNKLTLIRATQGG